MDLTPRHGLLTYAVGQALHRWQVPPTQRLLRALQAQSLRQVLQALPRLQVHRRQVPRAPRHLQVLQEAGLVGIRKTTSKGRSLTRCRLTAGGRRKFLAYVTELERVVRDAMTAGEA